MRPLADQSPRCCCCCSQSGSCTSWLLSELCGFSCRPNALSEGRLLECVITRAAMVELVVGLVVVGAVDRMWSGQRQLERGVKMRPNQFPVACSSIVHPLAGRYNAAAAAAADVVVNRQHSAGHFSGSILGAEERARVIHPFIESRGRSAR